MKKIILIIVLIASSNFMNAQICGTPASTTSIVYPAETRSQARGMVNSPLGINLYFHIVRNTDGTNAFTPVNTDEIIKNLNTHFASHHIMFVKKDSTYINNSSYNNLDFTDGRFLHNNNSVSNSLNYYIANRITKNDSTLLGGFTYNTSNSLFVTHNWVSNYISSHEVGHALGLHHTHRGTVAGTGGCAELHPSQSPNCEDCGDLVCDTPADNRGGSSANYMPDLTNIMSYYHYDPPHNSLDHFTNGQGERMRQVIRNNSILQNVIIRTLSSINLVCSGSTTSVSVNNLGNLITTWTSSSNVQIVSNDNCSATIRAVSSSSSGNGWVKATLSNGVVLQEDFEVGIPNIDGYKIYNTSYNGNYIEIRGRIWNYFNIIRDDFIPNYYTTYPRPLRYKWDVTANNSLIRANSSRLPRAVISPNQNSGGVIIGIRAENGCGCTRWKWHDFIVRGVGGFSVGGGVMEEDEGF